jgi:hypothetical protein
VLAVARGRDTAAVEGIKNKARVITKRCYGVKSSDTLWKRLIRLNPLYRFSGKAGQRGHRPRKRATARSAAMRSHRRRPRRAS